MEPTLNTNTGELEYQIGTDGAQGKKTLVATELAQTLTNKTLSAPIIVLPTEDPLIAGALWNDEGVVTVSAGPE